AKNLTLGFGSTEIFQRLDFEIKRGDRIGIIGANGSGKSTLLSALRGDITPITGTLKNGTNLEFSTFFQEKYNINFDLLMKDYVSDKKDYVEMNGNSRHIIGYLKGFLFNPDECLSPLKTLSGGQVNRSILAKTFLKPSNLLILDEPTNDLDIESLEALEDALLSYKGTLIVVSHDRYFLDKVVNRIFAIKKDKSLTTNFYGNYSEWLEKEKLNDSPANQQSNKKDNKNKNNNDKKVSYIAQRNIDKLMKEIEILESELAEDADYLSCNEFKELSYEQMSAYTQKYNEKKVQLDALYDEWEKLNT
ncbi:MAG: ATP-binding cassette domain-containing protein, partial [Methylophilaceae bacterium]